jgi:hypothetical protein
MADDQQPEETISLEEFVASLGGKIEQKTGTTFIIGGPKRPPPENPPKTASESEPEDG